MKPLVSRWTVNYSPTPSVILQTSEAGNQTQQNPEPDPRRGSGFHPQVIREHGPKQTQETGMTRTGRFQPASLPETLPAEQPIRIHHVIHNDAAFKANPELPPEIDPGIQTGSKVLRKYEVKFDPELSFMPLSLK